MKTVKTNVHYLTFGKKDLNPETRDWYYDSAGNRFHKEDGAPVVLIDTEGCLPSSSVFLSEDNMNNTLDVNDNLTITVSDPDQIDLDWGPDSTVTVTLNED